MPVAMIVGLVCRRWLEPLGGTTPYFLFAMLFIPFCGVRLSELRLRGWHFLLLGFQIVVSTGVYIALRPIDPDLAQGAMICVLAPTATAAVVIASMLGASVSTMLSYSLLVNCAVAVAAPLMFTIVAPAAGVTFWGSLAAILGRVIPVLIGPLVAAQLLQKLAPRAAEAVRRRRVMSFYLWVLALTIVTARIAGFVEAQEGLTLAKGLALAGIALILCLLQFAVGRWIGARNSEATAGGQALGQKNTILAIWLAQSCLNPVSSIAPAAYVLWQNLFNSAQLYLAKKPKI